ncbi:MAG TPA: hypothetical protein ENJ00_01215 [Phycisphaerales bacterium]|nr:hypothetical protein [Phycisphaerales bacterium]
MTNADAQTNDRAMTWAMLLAKWTEFAQSALALPGDDEGGRLKEAVPAIITLQAVTHACAELDQLDHDERSLGIDRAEILLRRNAAELNRIWSGQPMPEAIIEIVEDARLALRLATEGGSEWRSTHPAIVLPHPADLVAYLMEIGFAGDLFLPTPGVPMFEGSPIGFVRGVEPEIESAVFEAVGGFLGEEAPPERVPVARQVYRQFDFAKGGPVRDLVQRLDADLTPGQPLLIPVIVGGEPQPVPLPIPGAEHQKPVPVEFGPMDEPS